jgi:hypothetical protein
LGKLHLGCVWICATPQRKDGFRGIQIKVLKADDALMLRMANATRWDSTFMMIDRALTLHEAFDTFFVTAIADRSLSAKDRTKLESIRLKSEDWNELRELHKLLEPFYRLTKELQGNIGDARMNGALWDVLPTMDFLLQTLEDAKEQFVTTNPTFANCVNLAWQKLNTYYTLTDKSPVYVAAVLLDPRMRLEYFQRRWHNRQEWINEARTKFMALYWQYRDEYMAKRPVGPVASVTDLVTDGENTENVSALSKWKFARNIPLRREFNEAEEYLNGELESDSINPRE